jgi:hypothetical protein
MDTYAAEESSDMVLQIQGLGKRTMDDRGRGDVIVSSGPTGGEGEGGDQVLASFWVRAGLAATKVPGRRC